MHGDDRTLRPEQAVLEEQPAELAMRRVMAVQSVMSTDFDHEERALFLEVVPGMRRQIVAGITTL